MKATSLPFERWEKIPLFIANHCSKWSKGESTVNSSAYERPNSNEKMLYINNVEFWFQQDLWKMCLPSKWKIIFHDFHEKYDVEYIFRKFSRIQYSTKSEFNRRITNSTRILYCFLWILWNSFFVERCAFHQFIFIAP